MIDHEKGGGQESQHDLLLTEGSLRVMALAAPVH